MNIDRESVIRMAREAGWTIGPATINGLERFAALVAAAAIKQERKEFAIHVVDIARRAVAEGREACAKVCDHAEKNWRKSWHCLLYTSPSPRDCS